MDLYDWGSVAKWTARLLGLLYCAVIFVFVIAHAMSPDGLPILWKESLGVQLDFLALFLIVFGCVVGWISPIVATAMIVCGTVMWLLVERQLPWPAGLSLLIAALYAFTWWYAKRPSTARPHAIH